MVIGRHLPIRVFENLPIRVFEITPLVGECLYVIAYLIGRKLRFTERFVLVTHLSKYLCLKQIQNLDYITLKIVRYKIMD